MSEDLITVEIDGKPLQARRGAMIIEVADGAGVFIPRFCYHSKLSVAANCRMCLVDVEKMPKPVPACATPVADGMVVRTRSPLALEAQRSVMEFLLINHPLDCPICDQGGECELQDVAMGFGADVSRYQERKRVVPDKDIGPLVSTDMTRCIHCTRCVRFGEEVAGMRELGATGRGEDLRIGTYVEHALASELSGNIIDLCPVGALTSKPFRFSARAWEMQQRDSVAPHDVVGSNLHVHVRGGRVMRVVPRENEAVNEVWISDRDRFSYEGLYAGDRLTTPMLKRHGAWEAVDWETALETTASGLRSVLGEHGAEAVGALASPSCTTEELYLFGRLARGLGIRDIDHRVRQGDFRDQERLPAYPYLGRGLADLEEAGAVLLVGSNARKEQPLVNHRVRKAAIGGAAVMLVNPLHYDFNYPIVQELVVPPSQLAGGLAAIAKALLGRGKRPQGALGELIAAARPGNAHKAIAASLKAAERPAALLGGLAQAHPDLASLRALAGLICEHSGATLGYLPAGGNAAGAWLAGVLPHREAAGKAVNEAGLDARAMLEAGRQAYLLMGLEPELDCWNSAAALQALEGAGLVVSLGAFRSQAAEEYADVMLPVALFPETSGSYVNIEGRWQSFAAAVTPPGEARPAWKVLRVLGNLLGVEGFEYRDSAEVRDELRRRLDDDEPDNLGAWGEPEPLPASEGLARIGELPIYAVDGLVRRAPALQHTPDAMNGSATIHPRLAKGLGLADGDSAVVAQGEARRTVKVVVSPRVPEGCVLVPTGVPGTAGLGPSFGAITLEKV